MTLDIGMLTASYWAVLENIRKVVRFVETFELYISYIQV